MEKGSCEICGKKFNGMFVSEHQCKRCSRTICKECCTKKKPIFTKLTIKLEEHRCCDRCFPVSLSTLEFAKQSSLSLLSNSPMGKEWASLADIDIDGEEDKDIVIVQGLNAIKSINLKQMWQTNMTDTYREVLGISIGKMSGAQVEEVMSKIIGKYKLRISLENGLLLLYLLCYCSQDLAIKVFQYLLKIISKLDQGRVAANIDLFSGKSIQGKFKNIISNTKAEFVGSMFLETFPVHLVNELIMETLLAGTPTYIENALALLYNDHLPDLESLVSLQQIKQQIYKTIDPPKFNQSLKILRKKILQQEKKKKSEEKSEEKYSQALSAPDSRLKVAKVEEEEDVVEKKIKEAAEFLRKLESGELNEDEVNPDEMENLNEYLDQIIEQNNEALKECETFDQILSGIQEEMFKGNS